MLAYVRRVRYNGQSGGDASMGDRTERNRRTAPARNRYNAETYEPVTIRLRRDGSDGISRAQITAAAAAAGQSVNAWIVDAIKQAL